MERSRGPVVKAPEFRPDVLTLQEPLTHGEADESMNPLSTFLVACFWMLREIELANARLADVIVDDQDVAV
eukprot:928656-Alexandrium_andersonii.AAC.1